MKRGLKVFFGLLLLLIRWLPSWAANLPSLSLGDRLYVGDTLSSPSGLFEAGIYNYPAHQRNYYLCVRYGERIDQTVVWVANRGKPLSSHAFLELSSSSGDLRLSDPDNNVAWVSNTANAGVVKAELLDSGNLVLMDNIRTEIWDRFNNSTFTDTLLPGNFLYKTRNGSLTSWLRWDDPAFENGTYTFGWGIHDNETILQLAWKSPELFSVWRGGSFIPGRDEDNPHKYPVDYVHFHPNEGYVYHQSTPTDDVLFAGGDPISPAILKRLTLDSDGGLRIYQWNLSSSKTWTPVASWVVKLRDSHCFTIGTCGPFSVCSTPVFSLDRVTCTCPYGFEPRSATDHKQGCMPVVQIPGSDLCDTAKVNLTVHKDLDMPFGLDFRNLTGPDSANCYEECRKNCSCYGAVYSKDEGNCWMKMAPLHNLGYPTKRLHGKDRTAYIKVSLSFRPPAADGSSSGSGQRGLKPWGIAVIAVVGGFVLLLLGVGVCVCRYKRRLRQGSNSKDLIPEYTGPPQDL